MQFFRIVEGQVMTKIGAYTNWLVAGYTGFSVALALCIACKLSVLTLLCEFPLCGMCCTAGIPANVGIRGCR